MIYFKFHRQSKQCNGDSGFLTNELRVTGYELGVTTFCTSYELPFTDELQVITYYTSYKLIFTYELQVTNYCSSCDCNVDCIKVFYCISFSSFPDQLFLSKIFHE